MLHVFLRQKLDLNLNQYYIYIAKYKNSCLSVCLDKSKDLFNRCIDWALLCRESFFGALLFTPIPTLRGPFLNLTLPKIKTLPLFFLSVKTSF